MGFEIIAVVAGAIISLLSGLLASFTTKKHKEEALGGAPFSEKDDPKKLVRYITDLRLELSEKLTPVEGSFAKELGKNPVTPLLQARVRLAQDIDRVSKNSRLNLVVGVGFSTFGIILLGLLLIVLPRIEVQDLNNTVYEYISRLALSVFIQFVGFFFLRLHVTSENEIKNSRNEITNIDYRISAVAMIDDGDSVSKAKLANLFASEERNFVLKKGEKSISAENQSEYNDLKASLEAVVSRVSAAAGGKDDAAKG